jgi:hypothetical protein
VTSPVLHGYPDWGRATPAADVVFYQQFGAVANGFTQLGPYFVGATPAVGIFFRANGTAYRVQPTFWPDQAMSSYLGAQVLEFARGGVEYYGAIRTLGPWMTLDITPLVNGNTFDATVWAAPAPATIFPNHGDPVLIEVPGQVIGIGATINVDATRIHTGMAHFYLAQRVGTHNATLYSVDYLGTKRRLVSRAMATGQYFDEVVPLASGTIQIQVVNTSGAASSVDGHVVALQNMTE